MIDIRRESHCDRQCVIASQYAVSYGATTLEVIALMREISDDQHRMELAPNAYPYPAGRANYRQVVGAS